MPELHFAKPCTFTDERGEVRTFAPGRHPDVPEAIAEHWFVKAHLVPDGVTAPAPATAPLQHEERTQVKLALDMAEHRARGVEAERDAAVSRAEALQGELDAAKARIAELEADLDKATSPDSGASADTGSDAGGEADADDAAEFANTPHVVKRRFGGKYAVAKREGGVIVLDGLSKAEAEAKARELNGQG